MRFIFGVGSKLFVWETSVAKVKMRIAGDAPDEDGEEEEFEPAPPQDPHGTLSSHLELSPQVIYDSAQEKRRFGFGSEKPGG